MVRQYELKLPVPHLWEKLQFSDNQATSWSSTGKAFYSLQSKPYVDINFAIVHHVWDMLIEW